MADKKIFVLLAVKTGFKLLNLIYVAKHACYLITQNADPKKEVVTLGQTYFAVQTRKQELLEEEFDFNKKSEAEKLPSAESLKKQLKGKQDEEQNDTNKTE